MKRFFSIALIALAVTACSVDDTVTIINEAEQITEETSTTQIRVYMEVLSLQNGSLLEQKTINGVAASDVEHWTYDGYSTTNDIASDATIVQRFTTLYGSSVIYRCLVYDLALTGGVQNIDAIIHNESIITDPGDVYEVSYDASNDDFIVVENP